MLGLTIFLAGIYLFQVQSQQWKKQNNSWNLFKDKKVQKVKTPVRSQWRRSSAFSCSDFKISLTFNRLHTLF